MGISPGDAHFERRYEYCAEYVTIMGELWSAGPVGFPPRVLPDGCLPRHRTNFLLNIGYGDRATLPARLPRLDFAKVAIVPTLWPVRDVVRA